MQPTPCPDIDPADGADTARRAMLTSILATGFALAVRPVAATTLSSPKDGLLQGPVEIPVVDGRLPAWRAQPQQAASPLPVVLVIQEIFGVHEHIRDICRRLAHEGYLALAPELFFREGDPRTLSDTREIIRTIVSQVADAQVMSDLDACVEWTSGHGGDAARVAVTGFCWGGRISWLYAAHRPELKAAIAWYGRLEGAKSDKNPQHVLNIVTRLQVPVLGLYGGKDSGIPLESVERTREALANAGNSSSQIIVYPEAGHAFNADYRPSYHAASAADAWQRQRAWLHANGM